MAFKDFRPLFKKKVLLLTHSLCDVDSLASAAAIFVSLGKKADFTIGVPDHMNSSCSAFAKNIGAPFQINPSLDSFGAIICLDFNKESMLGGMKEAFLSFTGEKFLVDHHEKPAKQIVPAQNSAIDSKAISTTEIVHGLLKATKAVIPKKAFVCIAAGIITDSSSFMVADHETFAIMAEVMRNSGKSYAEIVSLFSVQKDASEKIAMLKAAQRSRIFRSGEAVIAIAEVGSFEADAASALIRAGADAAFCGYSDKGIVRVSGRANNTWLRTNSFDLAANVFSKLKNFFDGEGGGHAGAAGFNGKGESAEPALVKCTELVHGFLSAKNGTVGQLKEYK